MARPKRAALYNTTPPDVHEALNIAFRHFNLILFQNRLPHCLITVSSKDARSMGYFANERFQQSDKSAVLDNINMGPLHFDRGSRAVLSTLVHEMTHLEQFRFGTPSRGGYHNTEWGMLMRRVGLEPSNTGAPGGKTTGQQMTHYIVEGGAFDIAYERLMASGWNDILPVDIWRMGARKKKPGATRQKYTCPGCELNVWAKPSARLRCEDCDELMLEAG
jgi:predicted SprT family Zn-dependent metalloprotease